MARRPQPVTSTERAAGVGAMRRLFCDWHRLPQNAVEFTVYPRGDERVGLAVGEHVMATDFEHEEEAVVVALTESTATLHIVEHLEPVDVTAVHVVDGTTVELNFDDGQTRTRDLAGILWGPVFEQIRDDPAVFAQVRVDPELGTIAWPNGADISPALLRYDALWEHGPARPEE